MVLNKQGYKIRSVTETNLNFKELRITHICKPRLKNSYISVDKKANIILKTPQVSSVYIHNLLLKKEVWIRKKIKSTLSNPPLILKLDGIHSQKSKDILIKRVDHFAKKMGLQYSELKFRKMKSRWGSCSSTRVITLNKKLVKTPDVCVDYVIVHELAHLVHMNHSKQFHALVQVYIPYDAEAKKLLSRILFE